MGGESGGERCAYFGDFVEGGRGVLCAEYAAAELDAFGD